MQTINRNNYEEYFLLYADNELDAALKNEVERFVKQNADLAIEFEMLMQTKLKPEEIFFADKEILLRTEGNTINETNYEEYFLLYIDNELSPAKREEVEMYILQHPRLQEEFTGLKQAVLAREVISYGDKKDLYRTENRRTVYLKPWRFAAAAIFIGVCAFSWWLLQKPVDINSVADNHPAQNKNQNIAVKPVDTIQQQTKQPEQIIAQKTSPSAINKTEDGKTAGTKKKAVIINKEKDIAKHQPVPQKIITHNITEPNKITQHEQPVIENNDVAIEPVSSNKNTIVVQPQLQENNESYNNGYKMYDVAYKEINTSDDDNSLHVGVFDLNKSKVKNLFKKAGRLFGNKANNNANEDGKLQVANFEIQTNKQ